MAVGDSLSFLDRGSGMTNVTPVLDSGVPRRMWLGDACASYATFAIGFSLFLAVVLAAGAWVLGYSLFVPMMVLVAGPFVIAPVGACGIAIAWRLTLGLRYSARLRPGDYRFAGMAAVTLVWASAAAGEYVMHFAPGHAVASAVTWPLIISIAATVMSVQAKARRQD